MASHEYLRFILKTPNGYLTPKGTTEDICDKDIIVLNIMEIGGFFAPKERKVQEFLEQSTVKFTVDECEVLSYSCPTGGYYYCSCCPKKSYCNFWNDRMKCKIS